MSKCFFLGCNKRDEDGKNHEFTAPKKVAQEWVRLITPYRSDIKFNPGNRRHRLCFVHFREEDIIKGNTFLIQGKKEFLPNFNWRLKDDAIPRFLPKLPKHSGPKPKVKATPRRVPKNVKGGSGGGKEETKAYTRKTPPASVPVEEPVRMKLFPIETKGRCLICLMPSTKSKKFSDQVPSNKIGLENMLKEAQKRPTDPVSLLSFCRQLDIDTKVMGADQLEVEMKAQLCTSCVKQISDTLDCFRRLELVQRELRNYLLTIQNKITLETEGAKMASEMYRTDMMNDELSLPYLGIVDGIRHQIEVKCGEEMSKIKCLALPQAQQQSSRTKMKTYDKYSSKRRLVDIKQSEVVSISTPISSLVDEDNPDDNVKAEAVIPDFMEEDSSNSCGIDKEFMEHSATVSPANEEISTDIDPLIFKSEEYLEPNPSVVKEEQPEESSNILTLLPDPEDDENHSSDHHYPTETESLSTKAPTDAFLSKEHPTISEPTPPPRTSIAFTKRKNNTASNPVKCQLCKVELSSSSLEVMQNHFREAHPQVKIAKKCALCQKVYLGKHDNCPKQVPSHPFLSRKKPYSQNICRPSNPKKKTPLK